MKNLILTIIIPLISIIAVGNAKDHKFTPADRQIAERILKKYGGEKKTSSDLIALMAKELIGTPYLAGSLEGSPERLTINLRQTDCIIFVETCLSLALTVQRASAGTLPPSFELFCENLRAIRYRDGKVSGYTSRLHYTSEWIIEGEKNEILEEVTHLYGQPYNQDFSFMSSHPELYPQLKNNYQAQKEIKAVEDRLNGLKYHIVYKSQIEKIKSEIRNGDIICFTTKVKGLDFTHVGIAYWIDEDLHFIHASSTAAKVVIEEKTLSEYTRHGVRIVRYKF